MNKRVLIIALAVPFLALSGCVSEQNPEDVQGQVMTIRASLPGEASTKAGFSVPESGTGLHVAWKAGDNIRVISGSNSAVYTIQDGFTDHVASFSGLEVSGSKFDIVCPGTYASVEEAEAGNPVLTQNGNGNTDHLVFTAKLNGVAKADLPEIGFSDAWVAAHSGTTLNRGLIVKFVLTLPSGVTSPTMVLMQGLGKNVSVNLQNVTLGSDRVLTAYAQGGWEDVIIDGNTFSVWVSDADGTTYAATNTIQGSKTLKAGTQNSIKITGGFTKQLFAGGDGTENDPYLIANAIHLENMHANGVLKHGEKVYFRLINDIDMTAQLANKPWIPLNWESPYDYAVNFDGDGHTIDHFSVSYSPAQKNDYKNPGFFGLLYGECYDVSFTNATVVNTYGLPTGILAGYCGYDYKIAHVYNVHVQGSVNYKSSLGGADGNGPVGGLAGRINSAIIESCSTDVEIYSEKNYAGGIFGIDWGSASVVRNCFSTGSVRGDQRVGGIAGGLIKYDTRIINCYSSASVSATRCAGGIVSFANLDSGSNMVSNMPDNVIQGCIAWQPQIQTRTYDGSTSSSDYYTSGAIVGFTATHNFLTDCLRRSDMAFRDYAGDIVLYDQDNAGPSAPLQLNNPKSGTYKHYYPYHGKAFNGTLSQAARSLGWDQTVWDLSGSVPVLTGAVEESSSTGVPASGEPNVPAGTDLSRDFPENGAKWTVTEVDDGITFYHYYGTESWMDSDTRLQEVYVLDYDLSNTDYEVKLVCATPVTTCSDVFSATGAIAAINAGYEKGSIAVKGNMLWDGESLTSYPDGYSYTCIPNNYITDNVNEDTSYRILNWKSEGTFYTDGKQGVRIAFDGFLSGTAANYGKDVQVKTVQDERLFYQFCTADETAFVSSAPILIDNYVLFGRSWKDRHTNATASTEEPKAHQGQTCPRTAVAIAYPPSGGEHLLLVVCDGRYAAATGRGYGMSAYWLTRFMETYFGPKYMLNLDGGGSSTMCVNLDDYAAYNYVVNYPCDNNRSNPDHFGERSRDTFIAIVPAQ